MKLLFFLLVTSNSQGLIQDCGVSSLRFGLEFLGFLVWGLGLPELCRNFKKSGVPAMDLLDISSTRWGF